MNIELFYLTRNADYKEGIIGFIEDIKKPFCFLDKQLLRVASSLDYNEKIIQKQTFNSILNLNLHPTLEVKKTFTSIVFEQGSFSFSFYPNLNINKTHKIVPLSTITNAIDVTKIKLHFKYAFTYSIIYQL